MHLISKTRRLRFHDRKRDGRCALAENSLIANLYAACGSAAVMHANRFLR